MPAMLTDMMKAVFERSKQMGWVLEPDTKGLLEAAGLTVPAFVCVNAAAEASEAAATMGFPVVAKVVSPKIIHKSDVGGVAVGLRDQASVRAAFDRFSAMDGFSAMLVEKMVTGVELIVGAKVDCQFGPVILLGIGGTGVEIYQDVAIRMAPLTALDVASMIDQLVGRKLLEGYRGSAPVSRDALENTLLRFSDLVMDLGDHIESVDLNPVMCTSEACAVADARIMLASDRA